MNVEETIRQRRSVRHFTDETVSTAQIREMLSLAILAPNISNRQMWRFIALINPDLRRMLGTLVQQRIDELADWPEFADQLPRIQAWREQSMHFVSAPAVIAFISQGYHTPLDKILSERGMKFWEADRLFSFPDVQSISGVIAYLTLLAEERGYGTCWITTQLLAKKDLQHALELKPGEEIVAFLAIGKPAEIPAPKGRKPIDDLIEWR